MTDVYDTYRTIDTEIVFADMNHESITNGKKASLLVAHYSERVISDLSSLSDHTVTVEAANSVLSLMTVLLRAVRDIPLVLISTPDRNALSEGNGKPTT